MQPRMDYSGAHGRVTRASFWEVIPGKERCRSTQDFDFHRQAALVTAQLHDLGLLCRGESVLDAVVNVGLAHPTIHGLLRDTEIRSDLATCQLSTRLGEQP